MLPRRFLRIPVNPLNAKYRAVPDGKRRDEIWGDPIRKCFNIFVKRGNAEDRVAKQIWLAFPDAGGIRTYSGDRAHGETLEIGLLPPESSAIPEHQDMRPVDAAVLFAAAVPQSAGVPTLA